MFQLLPCSRCQRTFSVRSEVSDQALLKCPNCGNQFRLGELLDAFYGPWEILENPGVVSTGSAAALAAATGQESVRAAPVGALPVGAGLDHTATEGTASVSASGVEDGGLSIDGPELELAEDAVDGGAGLSLEGAGEGKPKTDWSTFKPITHEEFQRMKRADRSPFWSTLQVVLGGAAAIPVSLLLIWHVLGKDVAGAGPAVARYVPWVVPEKFRGLPPAEALGHAEPPQIPRAGESGFRNFDDVMPAHESTLDEAHDEVGPEETPADEGPVPAAPADNGTPSAANGNEPGSEDTPTPDNVVTEESAAAADQPTADVFALLNRTKQKVENWKEVATAKDTVKRAAALSLFEDLASLGVRLSMIPDTPGVPALVRDKVQEIARALKRQPDLTEVLHHAAKAQLNGNLPRSKEGWVLVCTVGEIRDQDDWWQITVADPTLLPLDVPRIEIPKFLAPQLTIGQRLLLLGKFIPAPQAESSNDPSQPAETASTDNSEAAAPAPETFRASFSYGL